MAGNNSAHPKWNPPGQRMQVSVVNQRFFVVPGGELVPMASIGIAV
jgi:hypothetical protein